MRIYTISDLHVDYQENYEWLVNLSNDDYKKDVLILGGDLTNNTHLFFESFKIIRNKFLEVIYIPGNHDLWVIGDNVKNSFEKLKLITGMAADFGIIMTPYYHDLYTIIPMYSWYDYTFGDPSSNLLNIWMDFKNCIWPESMDLKEITGIFLGMNDLNLERKSGFVITFSHFLPRIDLMPSYIPRHLQELYPVLGTHLLMRQISYIKPDIHLFGHSHVNTEIIKDGIKFINNAFGYPSETRIARKHLLCIYDV